MKKLIIGIALAVMVFSFGASKAEAAAKAQSNTGCGLGSQLITQNDTLLGQLAMTFLNGISGNQTFGITSGTSGCKQATSIVSNETNKFVAENMDGIAQDIAMGTGETIETLAELMNVPTTERAGFYTALQANFSDIYTSENVEAGTVIDNIVAVTS